MATAKRKTTRSSNTRKGGNSTLSTLFFGLLLGLIVAAGVAWFISKTPSPIHDASNPQNPIAPLANNRTSTTATDTHVTDPNAGLSPNGQIVNPADNKASTIAPIAITLPPLNPVQPLDSKPTGPLTQIGPSHSLSNKDKSTADAIGDLIKNQSEQSTKPAKAQSSTKSANVPQGSTSNSNAVTAGNKINSSSSNTLNRPLYLQISALSNQNDANSYKAKLLMMGYETFVQAANVNDKQVYRVRIGPFTTKDSLEQTRSSLNKAKINSTIVK